MTSSGDDIMHNFRQRGDPSIYGHMANDWASIQPKTLREGDIADPTYSNLGDQALGDPRHRTMGRGLPPVEAQ